jgi:apolipoprotein N-acyltransferase
MEHAAAPPLQRRTESGPGRMGAWAGRVSGLTGWRRRGMAALTGMVAALALPPVHLIPVLLAAFPLLVWLLDGSRSRRAAFGAGWWFGLGWFTVGIYWIAHALLVEPEKFGWMIPFATLGLGGVLAVFSGIATWAAHLTGVRGPGRVAMLASGWTAMEWARSWVLTGFPWNPVGSVWDPLLPMLQFGSVAGVFGLSLVTVLVFAMPALLADAMPARAKAMVLAFAAGLPLLLGAWGQMRLSGAAGGEVPNVRLRLVQAAIAQSHKWREDLRRAHLDDYVQLSRAPGFDRVTHVIWPETAAAYFLDMDYAHRARTALAAPPGGMVLTGAPRITAQGIEPFQVWNSLMAVTDTADIAAVYDKVHLVPFGEYVPLRAVMPKALNIGGTDFSPGPGLRTLTVPGLPPFSPLICYEAIFPGAVVGGDQKRPDWLLNITNDAWFGLSAGPYQHLASARMRAIEEGLPLVRSANTGISAVFDAMGRETARLGLGERGVVDTTLPVPGAVTPFARFGNLTVLALGILCAAMGLALRKPF